MTFIPADEDQFAEDKADAEVGARERELAAIRDLHQKLESINARFLCQRGIHDLAVREVNLPAQLIFGKRQRTREVIVFENLHDIENTDFP